MLAAEREIGLRDGEIRAPVTYCEVPDVAFLDLILNSGDMNN